LLAHVALAPMIFAAIKEKSTWRVVWVSYLLALAWWLFMIKWLMLVTTGGTVGACCVMALYSTGSLMGMRWWRKKLPWIPLIVSFPMLWTSLEMQRGFGPAGGFGWFALGHSQAPYDPAQGVSWFVQIADLFAEHGVSFVVAMSNAALAEVMVYFSEHRGEKKRFSIRTSVGKQLVAWVVVIAAANLYGWWRLQGQPTVFDSPTLTVAVVQTNVPVSNSEDHQETREEREQHWEDLKQLTIDAAGRQKPAATQSSAMRPDLETSSLTTSAPASATTQGVPRPDVIVWPETMVPASLNPEAREFYAEHRPGMERYFDEIGELAGTLKVSMIVGADAEKDFQPYTIKLSSGERHVLFPMERYNSAYYFDVLHPEPTRYDKLHRVPFGEYIPWVDGWPWLKDIFMKYFSPYPFDFSVRPGRDVVTFEVLCGHDYYRAAKLAPTYARVATPICFEDAVPRAVRHLVYDESGKKRVDVLVNLTNDGWYPGTSQNLQHFQIAAMRCIENRTPMARAVNTGPSGFIDSCGRVTKMINVNGLRQQVQGTVTESLTIDKRETVYGTVGYPPMVIMAVMTGVLTLWCLVKRERAS
jgi:apolipoprotein N-acyltransferase